MYKDLTNLLWITGISIEFIAVENTIENTDIIIQIPNKNSKNLVSTSYCDDMLFNSIFLNIKTSLINNFMPRKVMPR